MHMKNANTIDFFSEKIFNKYTQKKLEKVSAILPEIEEIYMLPGRYFK